MLEKLTVRIDADLNPFTAGLKKAVTQSGAASQQITAGWNRMKSGIAAVGLALAATVGVATGAGIKAFSSYEEGLNAIHTLVSATDEEMQGLGNSQRELAKEFGADVGAQLKGTYDAISASVATVSNATDHMRVVNKAATAGLTDQAVAGEAVIRVMRAYGVENVSATEASDFLFATVKRGVTTFGELAPKIGAVAGLAANVNLPLQELGASLATITGTASTDEAVTQLTQLLNAIIKPADSAAETAKKLGFDMSATALATKGLSGVIGDLQQRLGVAVDQEFLKFIQSTEDVNAVTKEMAVRTGINAEKLAELFPNIRALRGALALMTNDGKDFNDNLALMADMSGETDAAFEKMARGVSFAMKQAKSNLVDVGISVGDALGGPFLKFTERLIDIAELTTKWMATNKELVDELAPVVLTVAAVAAAMLPLNLLLSGLGGVFSIISGAAMILTGVFGLLAAGAGLLLSPFGLIIALVAAVVVAFVEDMGGIKPAWEAVTGFVIEKGTALISWFQKSWPTIKDTVVGAFTTAWGIVRPIVVEIGSVIIDLFSGIVNWFTENWPLISKTFSLAWETVKKYWTDVGEPTWDLIAEVIEFTWNAIIIVIETALKTIGGILKIAMGIFTGDWEQAWEGVEDIGNAAWDGMEDQFDNFWNNGIIDIGRTAGAIFTGDWKRLWDGAASYFNRQLNEIESLWDSFVSTIDSGWEKIFNHLGVGSSGATSANKGTPGNRFALGGMVGGAGGIDQVPIMASRGEYVTDAHTTDYFGSEFFRGLQAIASGGGDSGPGSTIHGGLNISIEGGSKSGRELAEELADHLRDIFDLGGGNGRKRGGR